MNNYLLSGVLNFITGNFKIILIGTAALIGLVSLICGISKGFYRTDRKTIKFAAVLFAFFFSYDKLAHKAWVARIISFIPIQLREAALPLLFLLAAIVAVNIVFGTIDSIVKYNAIKKMKRAAKMSRNPNPVRRRIEQRKIDKNLVPNGFSRFCGGIACILNTILGFAIGFSIMLFFASRFPFAANAPFASLFSVFPEKLYLLLHQYALDVLAVVIIVSVSYCGYRAGALNGVRSICMTFGILGAIAFGFFLPFSAWAGTGESAKSICIPVRAISSKFTALFGKFAKTAPRAELFGKLASGLTVSLLFILFIVLFSSLLKLITRTIRRAAPIRVIDGSICFLLTFVLGAALVVLCAALLNTLDYVDVFKGKFAFSWFYSDASPLNGSMKVAFDRWIAPALEEAKNALKSVMP